MSPSLLARRLGGRHAARRPPPADRDRHVGAERTRAFQLFDRRHGEIGHTPIPGATVTATNSSSKERLQLPLTLTAPTRFRSPPREHISCELRCRHSRRPRGKSSWVRPSSRADLELLYSRGRNRLNAPSNGRQQPERVEDFRACQSCRVSPPLKLVTAMEQTRSCRLECRSLAWPRTPRRNRFHSPATTQVWACSV